MHHLWSVWLEIILCQFSKICCWMWGLQWQYITNKKIYVCRVSLVFLCLLNHIVGKIEWLVFICKSRCDSLNNVISACWLFTNKKSYISYPLHIKIFHSKHFEQQHNTRIYNHNIRFVPSMNNNITNHSTIGDKLSSHYYSSHSSPPAVADTTSTNWITASTKLFNGDEHRCTASKLWGA